MQIGRWREWQELVLIVGSKGEASIQVNPIMQYNSNDQTSSEHPRMHKHPEGKTD